jgi:hypothetical protein
VSNKEFIDCEASMTKSTKASSAKDSASSKKLLEQFTAPRPSIVDRMEAGKRLRTTVPKGSLSEYKPQANRKDPVAILEAQAKTRLQNLVPVRHARMLTSPFAFRAAVRQLWLRT